MRVLDPITGQEINLPPSGFVSGIYARNDIERAVYKAPANEVVDLALGLEIVLNDAQQDVLNPEGINCFRFFEGRGFRLWGARTISSDSDWKYVNLRRYFAYLERSIDRGTQWAVFEPNGELLWANVRRTIEDFLLNEWQSGRAARRQAGQGVLRELRSLDHDPERSRQRTAGLFDWRRASASGRVRHLPYRPVDGRRKVLAERPNRMARVEFANGLRGLAALSVVIAHYDSFFFYSATAIGAMANTPPPVRMTSPALDCWQAILSAFPFAGGEFGVGLFFLISGFVIPMSLQRYNWRGFLVGRLFRIYPTYLAGFSITLFALWVAGSVFGKPFPYDIRAVIVHFIPGTRDLVWSSNIDFVVWTLEIEVKFYVVCAAAWIWLRRGDCRVFAIPLAMAACAIVVQVLSPGWLSTNALSYQIAYRLGYTFTLTSRFLAFMFIGVAFYYHHRRRLNSIELGAISMALLLVFWLLWSVQWSMLPGVTAAPSGLVITSYALAFVVFLASYLFSRRWPSTRLLAFFADISYPLYVVHGIAGYVALGIMVAHGIAPAVAFLLALSGALAISWLLHIAVELPTHRFGQRLARTLTLNEERDVSTAHASTGSE